MPIGKEETKISLFADGRTFYIRDSQNSAGKYFQLINNFSKRLGYAILQKSIHHQQTHWEWDNGYTPTHDTLKENKIAGISQAEEVKYL